MPNLTANKAKHDFGAIKLRTPYLSKEHATESSKQPSVVTNNQKHVFGAIKLKAA